MIKDRPKTETRRLSSRIRHHWNEGPGPAIAPRLFQKEAQDGYPPGLTGNCKVYNSSQADVMTRICCPCLYRHHRIRRSWSGRSHTAFLSSELPASPDPGPCDRRAAATTPHWSNERRRVYAKSELRLTGLCLNYVQHDIFTVHKAYSVDPAPSRLRLFLAPTPNLLRLRNT